MALHQDGRCGLTSERRSWLKEGPEGGRRKHFWQHSSVFSVFPGVYLVINVKCNSILAI